jgi:hypothetical protein
MVKESFLLLFEGERLFGIIDRQYEVFKKHGNTKKNKTLNTCIPFSSAG